MNTVQKATRRQSILLGTVMTTSVWLMPSANAQSADADHILKAMADYVGSQKSVSLTFDSDIEVVTSNLQKIQFTSSGQVQLSRPRQAPRHADGRIPGRGNCVRWQAAHRERQG